MGAKDQQGVGVQGDRAMPQDAAQQAADDLRWMGVALAHADEAFARGDWPTGAVLVRDGDIVATGQNRQNSLGSYAAHAEMEALQQAWLRHGLAATRGAALYCTMEPCPMCAGALKLAGIGTLVLALRHAQLGRTDLGHYTFEAFAQLTGFSPVLRQGVLEEAYLALRLRWGGDAVR